MKVFIYYNLHKKLWSIKDLSTGLVIAHSRCVSLRGCQFKVSKRGRERVIAERVKNVHAGVVGTLVAKDLELFQSDTAQTATYNPYKYETFVSRRDLQPLYQADTVIMVAPANSGPTVYYW